MATDFVFYAHPCPTTEPLLSAKTKIIVGVLGILVVVLVSGFLFLRFQTVKSFPVSVYRDEFGVPLVVAANETDLMTAVGFVHAQDRLWQMDMARRVAAGRLSEILGSGTLAFDRMFRTIGIRSTAEALAAQLPDETRGLLEQFSLGVNAFIELHKGKYPVEFDMLRYEPEPWLPVHSIMIGRLMAWEMNMSWWTDITYGAIADRVGQEHAAELFPPFPHLVPPTVPAMDWKKYAAALQEFKRTDRDARAFLGMPLTMVGSNAWAVAPAKSASRAAILANDAHLRLLAPAKWYEMHMKAPGVDVGGFAVAGVPAVVAGRNARIAWGITALMADDADFYVVQIDSADSSRYIHNGKPRPLQYREEEILIKGDSSVVFTVRATHHGPIVSDVRGPLAKVQPQRPVAMRWTGHELRDQLRAVLLINRAGTWEEFRRGLAEFPFPGLNFVYADVDGNIGYQCGALLPMRGKYQPLLPQPGWEKGAEWSGFIPFGKLPHRLNSPEGFIASANDKPVDDNYPFYIGELWEPPSRIVRLHEELGKNEAFSVEDFERLQNDKFSHAAQALMPAILSACTMEPLNIPEEEMVLEYLKNWNFIFSEDDVPTTIFQQFLVSFMENIYKNKMGDEVYHDFVLLTNIPIRVTMRLTERDSSWWFDDPSTEEVETRDVVIRKSMRDAVTTLRPRLGPDMKHWRWGGVHTVTIHHPFGLVKPLDRIFNVGPFPYGGGSTALMSGEYDFNDPFVVTVAASFRQIMDLSQPYAVRRVLPPGQSGQVLHPHYNDQMHLWLNGGYRTVTVGDTNATRQRDHLRLEPVR